MDSQILAEFLALKKQTLQHDGVDLLYIFLKLWIDKIGLSEEEIEICL